MGACQATLVQPRPYSSPGAPALLPARRASPSGGREARDKGVTYYSVDLGRVQRGGRDNDGDRDATVITVIPGRQSHQGRCRGARSPSGRATGEGSPARGPCHSRAGTLGHQFQLRMDALLPLVGSLSSSRVTSSSCALPFLPVAGAFRTWPQSRVPAVHPLASHAGLRRGQQVQLRMAYLLWEPPGDGPEGLHGSPPLRVVR